MAAGKLLDLLHNGLGAWFGRCLVCHATSPTVAGGDDLRALAAAKAAGWRTAVQADGSYRLTCADCVRRGR